MSLFVIRQEAADLVGQVRPRIGLSLGARNASYPEHFRTDIASHILCLEDSGFETSALSRKYLD
jgi:hypothetical protein